MKSTFSTLRAEDLYYSKKRMARDMQCRLVVRMRKTFLLHNGTWQQFLYEHWRDLSSMTRDEIQSILTP
jgi:hypothetical protein